MYNCTSSFMSNKCYLWLQIFYIYFTPSLKIYHTFTYMYKFQCMLCVLTFDKSATLSMASWSLTIQTYSLPKITKQEGKHHYSWQCSVYVLYKVQNLYSCGMSEYNSTVHVHALSLNWKKKMQVRSSVISNFCNLHTFKHQKLSFSIRKKLQQRTQLKNNILGCFVFFW